MNHHQDSVSLCSELSGPLPINIRPHTVRIMGVKAIKMTATDSSLAVAGASSIPPPNARYRPGKKPIDLIRFVTHGCKFPGMKEDL
jgi:hypothetical protein